MRFLGNVLWAVCGGLLSALCWLIAGVIWCASIVGIPIGLQCFKHARLAFMPFGKEVVYGDGAFSFLVNVVWFFVSGVELAAVNFALGLLLCLTVIGIPFGRQFFKIAKLALAPFGTRVVTV